MHDITNYTEEEYTPGEKLDYRLLDETYPIEVGVEEYETVLRFMEERPEDYCDYIKSFVTYKGKKLEWKWLDDSLKHLVRELPENVENLLEMDEFNQDGLYSYLTKSWDSDVLGAIMDLDEDFKEEVEAKVKEKLFDLAKNVKWEIHEREVRE